MLNKIDRPLKIMSAAVRICGVFMDGFQPNTSYSISKRMIGTVEGDKIVLQETIELVLI